MAAYLILLLSSMGVAVIAAARIRRFTFSICVFLVLLGLSWVCWYFHVMLTYPDIAEELPFSAIPVFTGWLIFNSVPALTVFGVVRVVIMIWPRKTEQV